MADPDPALVADLDPFDLLDDEAGRIYDFWSDVDDWSKDTRCEGWTMREMVRHFAAVAVFHKACLDDELESLFAAGGEAGVTGLDGFNAWGIELRADRPVEDSLSEWRTLDAEIRRRMRERGADATMASSIGPYPVGWMALHIASEYATHADDMDVPMDASEIEGRRAWRVQVGRFALTEQDDPPSVEQTEDGLVVSAGGTKATLTPREFMEATVARLDDDHPLDPALRDALRALA